MNLDRLRAQLIEDEGTSLRVYADSKGLPTVGVGHLVTPADKLKLGDVITQAGCDGLLRCDLARTVAGCAKDIKGWSQFPAEVQEVLANMAYNLGVAGLLKFHRTLNYLRDGAYDMAANALQDSKWYTQVGDRSKRLVARLRALHVQPISKCCSVIRVRSRNSRADP